jgi:hexosaminidase
MKVPALILSLIALSTVNRQVRALWPHPRYVSNGTSIVTLSDDFTIEVSGNSASGASSDLKSAIERTTVRLDKDRLERLVVGRGSADEAVVKSSKYEITALQVQISSSSSSNGSGSIADEVNKKLEDRDESYNLSVPVDTQVATIYANTSLGALRGLETFSQLVYFVPEDGGDDTALVGRAQVHTDPLGRTLGIRGMNDTGVKGCGQRYIMGAPIEIRDEPAFPYRGFLLDTSRNFYGIEDIERTLEAMSWAKVSSDLASSLAGFLASLRSKSRSY